MARSKRQKRIRKENKKLLARFKELPAEERFAKRDLTSQKGRDHFGDSLVGDMQRAWDKQDWAEYDRIKAILYNTT